MHGVNGFHLRNSYDDEIGMQAGNPWKLLFSRRYRPELLVSSLVAFFSQINVSAHANLVQDANTYRLRKFFITCFILGLMSYPSPFVDCGTSYNPAKRCSTSVLQGINAILFYVPVIFSSLGTGQAASLLAAVAVCFPLPNLCIACANEVL